MNRPLRQAQGRTPSAGSGQGTPSAGSGQALKRLDLDAIVLAGGESRRMGLPKALLPFGNTTLLGAILDILHPLFRRVLIVARERRGLEGLGVEVLTDDSPQRGLMVGVARGLTASDAPWCFAVGCDMPFLQPGVIRRMADNLQECDILAPYLEGHLLPLHTFYGRECLPEMQALLDKGIGFVRPLFSLCRVRSMEASLFLDLDPDLLSFRDLDTPQEYQAAQTLLQRPKPPSQPKNPFHDSCP